MKRRLVIFFLFFSLLSAVASKAQPITINGPSGSNRFGINLTLLSNGNYVVSDYRYSSGTLAEVGAVYLFNGRTNKLISTLTGSNANDRIGIGGTVALTNGNFVVFSAIWNSGKGSVTWVDGTSGLNGIVSSSNSLVGSQNGDRVGERVTALFNGNYVVWSQSWRNGVVNDAGAVTWGNGISGTRGAVNSGNSLVGSNYYDGALMTVSALTNGNYVVANPYWDNGSILDAGAVTWGNGSSGTAGIISTSNSLVGTQTNDRIGYDGVVALSNGNYVVRSSKWNNGPINEAGAVTWGDGTINISGSINNLNSLLGMSYFDHVGYPIVQALTNGNYVVGSSSWDNGVNTDAGAATWGNGASGTTGAVSTSNSLTAASSNSNVGGYITPLTNGNYVVQSYEWDSGSYTDLGAVTWGSGTTGIAGIVGSNNSLVGTKTDDRVGFRVTALSNGNYAVSSPYWDNSSIVDAGAVTWGNGSTGGAGAVSPANSLVGGSLFDQVGSSQLNGEKAVALTNGNYVVLSPYWDNGPLKDVGAATWCIGTSVTSGAIDSANSLLGSRDSDFIGVTPCVALTNGNYVISSSQWDNGAVKNVGAATWGNGFTGTTGVVSAGNSFIGTMPEEKLSGAAPLANGNYYIANLWRSNDTLVYAGSITIIDGSKSVADTINSCNSVLGTVANEGPHLFVLDNYINNYVIAGQPGANNISILSGLPQAIAKATAASTKTVSGPASASFLDTAKHMICSVCPSGAAPVNGPVTAKVYVNPTSLFYNGHAYTRRYYELTPANNASRATASITLYYAQSDFDDYNTNNGTDPDLPSGPTDVRGISNLKITQQHGTSFSGLPGNFNGWNGTGAAYIAIDPSDSAIIWNGCLSRWEVSFDITGFSGFFPYGSTTLDPLQTGLTSKIEDVYVSPVPAASEINIINRNAALNNLPAVIINVQGRDFCNFTLLPSQKIDVHQWATGIYILRLADGSIRKIIKE